MANTTTKAMLCIALIMLLATSQTQALIFNGEQVLSLQILGATVQLNLAGVTNTVGGVVALVNTTTGQVLAVATVLAGNVLSLATSALANVQSLTNLQLQLVNGGAAPPPAAALTQPPTATLTQCELNAGVLSCVPTIFTL